MIYPTPPRLPGAIASLGQGSAHIHHAISLSHPLEKLRLPPAYNGVGEHRAVTREGRRQLGRGRSDSFNLETLVQSRTRYVNGAADDVVIPVQWGNSPIGRVTTWMVDGRRRSVSCW